MHSHDDEDMLKVRANRLGGERVSAGLLEHYGDYVVPDVPLSQQLVGKAKTAKCIQRRTTLECESKNHTEDLLHSIY